MAKLALTTIGAYGWKEQAFFKALKSRRVDTFCDVRYRRGVRGAQYAFANAKRLRARLDKMGIRYVHFQELGPSPKIRAYQYKEDARLGVGKRGRTQLGQEFARAYSRAYLKGFNAKRFIGRISPPPRILALFCVEGRPQACHRSLLASALSKALKLPVDHIVPY